MSHPTLQYTWVCPDCGAQWPLDASGCQRCGQLASDVPGQRLVVKPYSPASPFSFSIASLLTLTALVAVCLGLGRVHPALSLIWTAVMIAIFLIYAVRIERRKALGDRITSLDRFNELVVSGIIFACVATAIFVAVVFLISF